MVTDKKGMIVGGTVDILSIPYRIQVEKLPDGNLGLCSPHLTQLWVNSEQALHSQQDTLLHEIVHALDFAMKANMTEEQVGRISTGMLAVLRANRKLTEWLLK